MKSGSISYSPDYKSDRHPQYVCPECYGNHAQSEHSDVAAQRARLEREAIELVKRWWLGAVSDGALRAKAKDLLTFEAEQEKKNS